MSIRSRHRREKRRSMLETIGSPLSSKLLQQLTRCEKLNSVQRRTPLVSNSLCKAWLDVVDEAYKSV